MAILDQVGEVPIKLTITLFKDGAMSVEGPIEDKAFCLAMLDHAKQAVKDRNAGVIVPPGIEGIQRVAA